MTIALPDAGRDLAAVMGGVRAAAGPPAAPVEYAKVAAAKLKRDRQSYSEFRAADQREHERAWKRHHDARVADAEENARLFRGDVEVLEPEAAEALEASRAAEDRARTAREYARTQEAEAGRIREAGTAGEATDAQVRADTADDIAAERQAEAAKAREELEGLERDLGEAREGLEHAEHAVRAARKAAEAPAGTARISDVTIKACAAWLMTDEAWSTLSHRDRQRIHFLAEPRPVYSLAEFLARSREAGQYVGSALWAAG